MRRKRRSLPSNAWMMAALATLARLLGTLLRSTPPARADQVTDLAGGAVMPPDHADPLADNPNSKGHQNSGPEVRYMSREGGKEDKMAQLLRRSVLMLATSLTLAVVTVTPVVAMSAPDSVLERRLYEEKVYCVCIGDPLSEPER